MNGKQNYQPPFTITPVILNLAVKISETVGRLSALTETANVVLLRRINRNEPSGDHWP